MKDEKVVKVLIIPTKNGSIRVATIEQHGRKPSPCLGCPAPCCRGSLLPVLNEEELQYKKFPFQFIESPDWLKVQVPRAQYLAVLKMDEGGCQYLNKETAGCTVYPNCPSACLSYDCQDDERMIEIRKTGSLAREVDAGLIPSCGGIS